MSELNIIERQNLAESERWRQAGVNTFFRKSLILAIVIRPGMELVELARRFETTRNSMNTVVTALEKSGLIRKEFIDRPKRKMLCYPTPYAKDVAAISPCDDVTRLEGTE